MKRLAVALALFAAATPHQALAWGAAGHRIIGRVAAEALPEQVPAFLRTASAIQDIGEYSREPDRWKGAGRVHDKDRDAAHFVDLDDEQRLLDHATAFTASPELRSQYESLLTKAGVDPLDGGYLLYAYIDAWQQLTIDFGYWRVIVAAEARETDAQKKAWYAADRRRREELILRDLGVLGHYVGDATNPLHTTIHYNGWGDHPNPKGYTTGRIHGAIEGDFVRDHVTEAAVRAKLTPNAPCAAGPTRCALERILESNGKVEALYALEKAGGFQNGDARGRVFIAERLGLAASHLRDTVIDSWSTSATIKVGWRPVAVADVEAGKVDPYAALYGID
jgi:hypothetical protein